MGSVTWGALAPQPFEGSAHPVTLRTKAGQSGSSGPRPALHREDAGGWGPKPRQEVPCLLVTGGSLGGLALGTTGGIVCPVKGGH